MFRRAYTGPVRTRCLSFHAAYRCRHSGACCRADWEIEVEPSVVEAVHSGRVLPLLSTPLPFVAVAGPSGAGRDPQNDTGGPGEERRFTLARTADGACGFHNHSRCSLQETGTERLLPSACRHFPRVILRDTRGCLMTLSHFCPTAASMLLDETPVTIVEATPPLALEEPVEGLDAREALPPLVRPGMLADVAGYGAWEDAVVQTFLQSPDAGIALATIEQATERVRGWTPGAAPLADIVADAFSAPAPAARHLPLSESFSIVRVLTGPHPLMDVPDGFAREWDRIQGDLGDVVRGPVARYLAACAFGNWIAYRGRGLRSVAGWLRACHDVLRVQLVRHLRETRGGIDPARLVYPIRMADYIMVHTIDSLSFGRAAVALEQ